MRSALPSIGALVVGLGLLALSFSLRPALAAPGDLDSSFGMGGFAETAIGSAASARAMALQTDGRIVLAGSAYPGGIALARYTPDGRLDPTFGGGGLVTGPEGTVLAVAIQQDGRIVTAGRNNDTDYVMSLTRYLPNGAIDSTFGSGGIVAGPPGDANAIAIQADGKIVVAGGSPDPDTGSTSEFTLLRFLSGGAPDPDFGSKGAVRTQIGSSSAARGLALQPDGKIVAGGWGGVNELRMAIARYERDGDLDPTFGSDGVATDPVAGRSAAVTRIALDAQGRIVAAGYTGLRMAVARYEPDGRVDRTFGTNGAATLGSGGLQGAGGVALQSDGRIVLVGYGANVFAVVRYLGDGTLDSTFGESGISRSAIGVRSGAEAVAIQPDGRILAAGSASYEGGTYFALARYRVSSPTAIHALREVVSYGARVGIAGTARPPEAGRPVEVFARGCYSASDHRIGVASERSSGDWSAHAKPRSRTAYRARIAGDRSEAVTVQVRPRISVRSARGRVQARVLFGRSLSGEMVALQRFRPAPGRWLDVRLRELARVGKTRRGIISAATFHAQRNGRVRVILRQPNPYACFADAISRAVRG
jgi:uncharacterized delta-60 repeat protein